MFVLFFGELQNSDSSGNILFTVAGRSGNILTSSTMTFNASVQVISNGTSVSCGGAMSDMPRVTFDESVEIFGKKVVTILYVTACIIITVYMH